jgi:hypothetical protein
LGISAYDRLERRGLAEIAYDPLHHLCPCEDDFVPVEVTPTTVVCTDVWGNDGFKEQIEPIIQAHELIMVSVGLTEQGIAATFNGMRDAAIFRLFYDGDTKTGA